MRDRKEGKNPWWTWGPIGGGARPIIGWTAIILRAWWWSFLICLVLVALLRRAASR